MSSYSISDPSATPDLIQVKRRRIERLRANLPPELLELAQWVVWKLEQRDGKPTKVPYDARTGRRAKSNDRNTWSPFEQALAVYERGSYDGVGFMFSADDPYLGVDFDDCITDTGLKPDVAEFLKHWHSYCEYSQSGSGVHVILRGVLAQGGVNNHDRGIEIYDRGRFFVMTGERIEVDAL